MDAAERLDSICAQHGWTPIGGSRTEADSHRQLIRTEAGDECLLYAFEDPRDASRAAQAHSVEFGAQLFAIPELVESGHGWILLQAIDGENLAEFLGGDDLFSLPEHHVHAIVDGVAQAMRKLHGISISGYGDILQDQPEHNFLTFSGWAARQLEWVVEHSRIHGLDDDDAAAVSEAVARLRHELAAYHPRSPAGLTHGRPHLEHIWIAPGTFEVVGLTGLHHMASLPREIDIAIFLWLNGLGSNDSAVTRFYRSYGAARTMDVQRRERFFRRLAAFLAISGRRGPSPLTPDELIRLTSA